MSIDERYGDIVNAACDVIARRGFQAASTREIAGAAGLSLAGLYHYVGSKEELLFLVLDHHLDSLIAALDGALAAARTPEARLLALIRSHLEFASRRPAALKVVNRDHDLVPEPHRAEIARKRQRYVHRGLAILRDLDRHDRSEDALLSATTLLLGMLNGIATRPFLRAEDGARDLAADVGALFLHGFLGGGAVRSSALAGVGGDHDDRR